IDPANRAPLFELVFHDCVVNYWYWGATNDYLHAVAPEITDRKTAMNVLYGTPPMMWVNSHGLRWGVPDERQLMIDIYQQTCKLHEIIADQEMVSHEFLDPARKVQRTTFADGTVCTVNFADEPYPLTADGREFRLGTNDFYVKGPRIVQWRLRTGGANDEREVFIRTRDVLIAQQPAGELVQPGFRAKGKISVQRDEQGARISVQPGGSLEFDLAAGEPAWAKLPATVLRLDDLGRPAARGPQVENGIVRLGEGQFALLVGDQANRPDVVVTGLELTVDGKAADLAGILAAAQPVVVRVLLENRGLAPAVQLPVTLRLDGEQGPLLIDQTCPQLAPGEAIVLTGGLPLERMDGERRLLARIGGEAFTQTGPAEASVRFAVAVDRERFPVRQPLAFHIPVGDTVGLPVELPLALVPEADPANLRVFFANGTATPAQFEPAQPGAREGTLVFVLPAGLAAGEATAELLGVPTGDDRGFPPTSRFAVTEDGSRLQFTTYEAKLILGTLTDIAVRQPDGTSRVVVGSIIESSKETGWSDESGEVTDFALEANGPVRAVFRVAKTLKGDYKLTRRFVFYGDRCEIVSACNPHRGLLTRTMYAVDGIAENETGAQAVMDGKGDAEDFGFKGSPHWFAVFGPNYRSVCFALTPASTFTYWDGGTWRGQIGLGTASGTERRVYVWGAEKAENADYAKALWQAYGELRGE
ncbi:MAG: glycoside hydrolase, partial [Lentisphaeria bacterium]|nr:glycoside hydrolase [Lentisphaeria bacterium]